MVNGYIITDITYYDVYFGRLSKIIYNNIIKFYLYKIVFCIHNVLIYNKFIVAFQSLNCHHDIKNKINI